MYRATKIGRGLVVALALGAGIPALASCAHDGRFEEAGESLDEAVEETGDELDDLD